MAAAVHRPVLDEDLNIEGAFVSTRMAANQTVDQALQRHSGSFGPSAAAAAHMDGAELSGWMAGVVDRGGHGRILAPYPISHVNRDFADFPRQRSDYRSSSKIPEADD
jgi:hypothetical protein